MTSARRLPEFVTSKVARPEPSSVTRAGVAARETKGRAALAPADAGASASTAGATASATTSGLTVQSP
jgi:rRNA maturation endonuclease Nob1